MLDVETRKQILRLYVNTHRTQKEIAAMLKLPVELVADVLDWKL